MNELDQLHKLQLEIALEIKRVCKKNDIRFFLAYGSLLGAVRHKGFIPWDDDLDIAMLRKDYEKFIRIFNSETNRDKFFLENWDTGKKFGLTFSKIKLNETVFEENSIKNTSTHKGIFVDVFPYDGLPNDKEAIKKTAKRVLVLGKIYKFRLGYLPTNPRNKKQLILSKSIGSVSKLFTANFLRNILSNEEQRFNNDRVAYTTFISGAYNCRDYFDITLLNESTNIMFEGELFPVPANYDKVLTAIYGDYMKLPPVDQRVCRHNAERIDFGRYASLSDTNHEVGK